VSDASFQAGQYQLQSVILRNYARTSQLDITGLIVGFRTTESMSSPFIYGKTTVFDGNDIISTLPIIGEEYIEFNYTDFFGMNRIEEYMVYSVSDIQYPDDNNSTLIQYTLNFVSIPRIFTDATRIMKGLSNDKISEYVKQLFNDTFKKTVEDKGLKSKELYVQYTDEVQTLIIPNYTATEAFMFFARHAFNASSKTQTFRFFENRDKYFFATNEEVEKIYGGTVDGGSANSYQLADGLTLPDAHTFVWNYLPNIGPDNAKASMFYITSIDFGEKVNTINDIKYGAYKKKIAQIDLLNGTVLAIPTYSIKDDFNKKNQKLSHSDQFISENMPDKYVRYLIKDYAASGEPTGPAIKPDMHYADLYDRKTSYMYHYRQNSIDITVYGNNKIVAGSVINIQLPLRKVATPETASAIDIERSGYYAADSIENIFANKTYVQKITLSRYGTGMK
jgi:hypothetical protein